MQAALKCVREVNAELKAAGKKENELVEHVLGSALTGERVNDYLRAKILEYFVNTHFNGQLDQFQDTEIYVV